jgi:glycosyltransferase involved in cell wall biosynthesis
VAFLAPSTYLLTLACKFTKTKVLISERTDPNRKKGKDSFLFKVIEYLVNTADAFVFQTEGARSYYPKEVITKSIVIPNPVVNKNIPKQYQGGREKVIVNVARLTIYQKRQDVLIKAFSKVLSKYPDYRLRLYGDGPDEFVLKKLVKELNIIDNVLFMGVSHDVYNDIRKAALFVLSSDFEGIPNALLEAMSMGLPCISTDCSPGGARLLIKENENGLLVPTGDPDKLAKAMEYILSHPTEASKMSNKALEVVDEYAEGRIYAEWESFINDVCKKCKKQ